MQDWPVSKIERRKVSALVPYANNARTHSDEQVQSIAASIREWGWTTPILVDEANGIIAGHARVQAAKSLGVADVPVIVAKGWSEAQKRAYVIADNQLALNAGWDENLLRIEITALDGDFDIGLLGFNEDYLTELLVDRTAGLTDPDDAPPLPDEPISRPGDLWLLGNHRLLCGDATSEADVARLLGEVKPNLMVTDPPYGVSYDPEWRDERDLGIGERSRGKVPNDDRIDWHEAFTLFAGQIAYVWHASWYTSQSQAALEAAGFSIRSQIIWAKQHFAMSRGDYHWQHEPCWYAVRKRGHWTGDRKQTTLWTIANNNAFGGGGEEKFGHGTQKPVECMRRPIVNNSSAGQAVYDPFLGSGTTMIAAEMEGRQCFAMEISPGYVDVAVKRWEAFTGQKAELDYDAQDDSRKSYDAAIEAKRLRANAAA